ncbi:MAG: AAA family ATPase [Kiritimatiellaeota bacterium]|nr:AAA family ATPase [Kiritimatiellota bacterium]
MKRYTVFAGINGAGKSTFYHGFYTPLAGEQRINTDEMVARIGSWQNSPLQLKCAREAVRLIKQYLEHGISFNQETTLTGRTIVSNIKTAKMKGYDIHLYYVGLENSDIALQRIEKRVREGGHGITTSAVLRRYDNSFENLNIILQYCDKVALYDNSDTMTVVAKFSQGNLVYKSKTLPSWLIRNPALQTLKDYYF